MVITLTGENGFLRTRELRKLVDAFVAEYTDMGLERLDGEEASYERMHEAVQSLPFLAPKKLIILRTPSSNNQFVESFEQFLGDIAETNDVVLVEPKLDKRLSYYKTLKKQTDFRDFVGQDGANLSRTLVEYAKEQSGALSVNDARTLVERVGEDQQLLMNELDKLLTYDPNVTKDSIELLTEKTPQSSIFELLDAAFAGNTKRAMDIYQEQRSLKVEPQQIIAMLVWQLYILALIKTAKDRTIDDIAKDAKLNPFVVRKSSGLAHKLSLTQLKELVTSLREFDTRLKSESVIADDVVQFYLLELAQ
ncbi:MAG: DNA polymerase III subunit delta [Candidatus Saccharimonadales bacterium]